MARAHQLLAGCRSRRGFSTRPVVGAAVEICFAERADPALSPTISARCI